MNKDQLGYFSALYQTHSVSAAALQVPMSVQGLNKSIHALESELGVTLFEAGENGSRIPTSYADAFARHVEEVGESYDHLIEIFAAIKAAEKKDHTSWLLFGGYGLCCFSLYRSFHEASSRHRSGKWRAR